MTFFQRALQQVLTHGEHLNPDVVRVFRVSTPGYQSPAVTLASALPSDLDAAVLIVPVITGDNDEAIERAKSHGASDFISRGTGADMDANRVREMLSV